MTFPGFTTEHPVPAGGWDYRTAATDPDDTLKFGRVGEQYPRLYIDPATGKIYAGTGTAPPTAVGETYSNALLLACSDAPESWKAQATYVADGTDDEEAWNATALVAAASGRNVLVSPGTLYNGGSAPFYIYSNLDYCGAGRRGANATVLTSEDGVTPSVLVKVDGTDANNRIEGWTFHGFKLDSDAAGGSTKLVNLMEIEWGSNALVFNLAWGNTSGHALKMLGFWDSEVHSFRLDGCGSRNAANEAAVKASLYMWSDDSTLANCNNVRFHHFITENTPSNRADAWLYVDSGAGSDDNHNSCSFTDFKAEHRSVINQASNIVPAVLLDGAHNFDIARFHLFIGTYSAAGSYTPQPHIIMRNNLGTQIGPWQAQGVDTGVGTASIRSYIKTEGTNTGCLIDGGRVSANTGNVPSVAPVEIGGTFNSQMGSLQWWYDSTGGTAEIISGYPLSFTPTIYNSALAAIDNTGGVNYGSYELYGVNRVKGQIGIELKAGFSDTGLGIIRFALPKTPKARQRSAGMTSDLIGYGTWNSANAVAPTGVHRHLTLHADSNNRGIGVLDIGASGTDYYGEDNPANAQANDQVWLNFDYEYDT